eukprot:g4.t1
MESKAGDTKDVVIITPQQQQYYATQGRKENARHDINRRNHERIIFARTPSLSPQSPLGSSSSSSNTRLHKSDRRTRPMYGKKHRIAAELEEEERRRNGESILLSDFVRDEEEEEEMRKMRKIRRHRGHIGDAASTISAASSIRMESPLLGPSFGHSPSHEVFNKVYKIVSECFETFSDLHEKLYGKPAKMRRTPYPMVLLIGNHSSGKSTFLNWVCRRGIEGGVRERDIQKTGRAPTDDVFTVIVGGPKEQHLDFDNLCRKEEFESLKKVFGTGDRVVPVEMKVVKNCDALGMKDSPRKLAIVDSPGIIGSPVSTNDEAQQYFKRLTKYFADLADVVLLFFDPDKPGTTKEANDVFRECLAHINSVKLHIIFNKVDAFKSLEDFGKAHGTLYWNLSAAMQRKDVPIVHNMFCPTDLDARVMRGSGDETASPLRKGSHAHSLRALLTEEFEQTRKLIEGKVRDAPKRATENTIHQFTDTLLQMHMHGCMLTACGSMYRRTKYLWRGMFWATVAGTAVVAARLGWVAAIESHRRVGGGGRHVSGSSSSSTTTPSLVSSIVSLSTGFLSLMDHFLTPEPWRAAFNATWRVGAVGSVLATGVWLAGAQALRRAHRTVISSIDSIWTEFGFSIRDGVLHRRKDPRSPNLVRSKWHADVDEEVAALWRRTKPHLMSTLEDHYESLADVPTLTDEDENLIVEMLTMDGAEINKLARS